VVNWVALEVVKIVEFVEENAHLTRLPSEFGNKFVALSRRG